MSAIEEALRRQIAAQAELIEAMRGTLSTREAHLSLLQGILAGMKDAAAGRTTPLEQVDPTLASSGTMSEEERKWHRDTGADYLTGPPREYTLNELHKIARVNNQDSPVVKALRYAIDALLEHQRRSGAGVRLGSWQCTLSPEDVAIIAHWYSVAKVNGAVVRETSAPVLAKIGLLDEGGL